jgi:hypothetical protein
MCSPKPDRLRRSSRLKHGFYSRQFRSAELQDLEALELKLEDEIAAARVAGRRMLELSEEASDPAQSIRALAAFSRHLVHIASLMRTHAALTGNSNQTAQAITAAIQAVAREFNLL